MSNIKHLAVHIKAFDGTLHRVASDNAEILVDGTDPFASDTKRDAIRKVAEQPVIEVERGNGSKAKIVWAGPYAELVAVEV